MQPTIVLLHGGSDSRRGMEPLAKLLAPWGRAVALNWPGHGGRPACEQISIPAIAADIVQQLDDADIQRPFLFGYSLGGYVAMYLARHYPARVRGICTLATKVVLDAETISHWVHLANPERSLTTPAVTAPTRAEELAVLHHPEDWRKVQGTNREMYRALGTNPAIVTGDLRAIQVPALVMSGDEDRIVSAEETRSIADALGSPAVLFKGPAHPLPVLPQARIADIVGAWMTGVTGAQRRAASPVQP